MRPADKEEPNMEIQVSQEVIDTVCNSLRASRYSLQNQLRNAEHGSNKEEIIKYQLADVEEALRVFQNLES
jgi:hypothetical protein